MYVVTVDFDWKERSRWERTLFKYRLLSLSRILKMRIAKTHKGYHVYIYIPKGEYSLEKALPLRTYLLDDEYRIKADLDRWRNRRTKNWVETLFHWKKDYDYAYTEKPVSIRDI